MSEPTSQKATDLQRFDALVSATYYASLVCHFLMILAFWLLGKTEMAVFNVGSVSVIALAVWSQWQGRRYMAFFLYTAEIGAHAVMATVMLGWESGYFIYVTLPMMIISFLPDVRTAIKGGLYAMLIGIIAIMVALTSVTGVVSPLDPTTTHMMLLSNFVLLTVLNGAFTLIFNKAIIAVDTKLRRFSANVSEFLDPMLVDRLRREEDVSARKVELTSLFSDLVGSTAISREMDADAYGEMIKTYATEMQKVVKAHNGYLEDISGDGIFAYVGSFDSKGPAEDAADVVQMAIDMHKRLDELNPEFARDYGLPRPLKMRVGIASGPALVGKTPGARALYTANGESVNLAAKLETALKQITADGGILICPQTLRLGGGGKKADRHELDIGGEQVEAYTLAAA